VTAAAVTKRFGIARKGARNHFRALERGCPLTADLRRVERQRSVLMWEWRRGRVEDLIDDLGAYLLTTVSR
jgi:hypothetical protein